VHKGGVTGGSHDSRIHRRLTEGLYVEAMLLADEARAYFDEGGRREREALDPFARVAFSCESLKVTTRLMHVIAWLLTQHAVAAGEIAPCEALDPSRRLGDAPQTDAETAARMPARARPLIAASIDLHRRVGRLDAALDSVPDPYSPARSMQQRLALSF
jgi:regulator of CtrA degradation